MTKEQDMQFHSKETPRIVGKHQFKETTGNGVPGYNPGCNQPGHDQTEEASNPAQAPNE